LLPSGTARSGPVFRIVPGMHEGGPGGRSDSRPYGYLCGRVPQQRRSAAHRPNLAAQN
jgi:hypothetical protein